MVTIGDSKHALERSLGDVLRNYLPQTAGYAVEVDILEKDRKKRSDASRESWRPAIGEIRIRFGGPVDANRERHDSLSPDSPVIQPGGPSPDAPEDHRLTSCRTDIIISLERAAHRPGFDFVALKWFRDLFLPAERHEWSESSSTRHELIRGAIEDGVILTNKVPNPKAPAFPVTAIRLNRRHPEVIAALGEKGAPLSDFEPVDIMGEPLSTTVLTDRR